MMTVFCEPNCWAISCRPRFPASLTWATVLCQRLLPGYSSTSARGHLEVAEYALSPTYPLMCWIYRQIKRKEGVISGRISETPRDVSSGRSKPTRWSTAMCFFSQSVMFAFAMLAHWNLFIIGHVFGRKTTCSTLYLVLEADRKHWNNDRQTWLNQNELKEFSPGWPSVQPWSPPPNVSFLLKKCSPGPSSHLPVTAGSLWVQPRHEATEALMVCPGPLSALRCILRFFVMPKSTLPVMNGWEETVVLKSFSSVEAVLHAQSLQTFHVQGLWDSLQVLAFASQEVSRRPMVCC